MKSFPRPTHILTTLVFFIFALTFRSPTVLAQDSPSVLYVPIIGLTSIPSPLSLSKNTGSVTYNYAVKNFLREAPLSDIQVVDDSCDAIKFVTGDDNNDSKLDFSETWRYRCTTKLDKTTRSIATAVGHSGILTATHKAYTTVLVGTADPAPLVSIINITKVAYPLSLPVGGGQITYTYKVNNPGAVPLSNVSVSDEKCRSMSGKLGDTNGNNLLDTNEVWIYTCTTTLKETTTNTATVLAFANGYQTTNDATITVHVDIPAFSPSIISQIVPNFPNTGIANAKLAIWIVLLAITLFLIILLALVKIFKLRKTRRKTKSPTFLHILEVILLAGSIIGIGFFFIANPKNTPDTAQIVTADPSFGWKFPITKFPITGINERAIAYSSIRDPGGVPRGLPVRLKIPSIGVDTAIEDALITPDGRMDVPAGSVNVAWFSLGPYPGRPGSAVIGGHYGLKDGVPFVFYDLNKLKSGDKVYVVDDSDNTLAFVVRSTKSFDRNADATSVFTSSDGIAHLNLITCEGVWNKVNDTYPLRLVVFTDAVTSEGPVTVNKATPIPAKTVLPATAITTPSVTPTPTSIASSSTTSTLASPTQALSSLKTLYATPTDALITTILFTSTLLVALKLVQQFYA